MVTHPDQADRLRAALIAHGTMGLGQLQLLLAVAARPKASISELAEMNGIPQQTASRYVANLSGRYQYDENDQPELLSQSLGVDDPRKRSVELTDQGEELVNAVLRAVYDPAQ